MKTFWIAYDYGNFKPIHFNSNKMKFKKNGWLDVDINKHQWMGIEFLKMAGINLKPNQQIKCRIQIVKDKKK